MVQSRKVRKLRLDSTSASSSTLGVQPWELLSNTGEPRCASQWWLPAAKVRRS